MNVWRLSLRRLCLCWCYLTFNNGQLQINHTINLFPLPLYYINVLSTVMPLQQWHNSCWTRNSIDGFVHIPVQYFSVFPLIIIILFPSTRLGLMSDTHMNNQILSVCWWPCEERRRLWKDKLIAHIFISPHI